ncbi:stretch-activated cation channel mid1 [Pichia californica]|nr:stretch-activated cation channel mid1 [[Candida] californica]
MLQFLSVFVSLITIVLAVELDYEFEYSYTLGEFHENDYSRNIDGMDGSKGGDNGRGRGGPHNPSKNVNPIDLTNVVQLTESTPVKDSINYNGMLVYIFEPDISSEWTHSYQLLVYISASLCQLPSDWNTSSSDNGLSLYYTFNRTVAAEGLINMMSPLSFTNGYAEGLAEIEMQENLTNYTLYMVVLPDDCDQCTDDSSWVYEFAVSQKNLLFLYDSDPYISVVDVDYNSVIFEAGGINFGSNRSYGIYIFEDGNSIPTSLNQSWCAISESTEYEMKIDIAKNTTLSIENAFIVSGLEMAKRYLAVLVVTFTGMPYGGGVFQQYGFTMSTSKACKLAYNLDFCDEVSYAIPVSTDFYNGDETWAQMIAAYDNYSESLYTPFEYAMQQIPCDTELDARYSPIRDCDDCKYSYKQWLCAVTIPRCISQSHAGPQNKLYAAGKGRNSFIANTINPPLEYAEVLPCLNVCQAIVRDCPSDFGFQCPSRADLVGLSYGDPTVDDDITAAGISITTDSTGSFETYRVCNYIGEKNLPNTTSDS